MPALLLIGGAVLLMIGFNARMWRAHKALVQQRVDYGSGDFLEECRALGVSPEIAEALLAALRDHYPRELVPQPRDSLTAYLGLEPEDVEDIVARCWSVLGWERPDGRDPQQIPVMEEVGDIALWLEAQRHPFTPQADTDNA